VGDVFFTQKCYRHLESLLDRGAAIVLVTHDTTAVSQFCSSVLVLDHGQRIFLGDTTTGIRTYYSLQRQGAPMLMPTVSAANASDARPSARDAEVPDWPSAEAALPLEQAQPIGEGGHCTFVGLTDDEGRPCRVFEMGQGAIFWSEIRVFREMEVPVVGVELFNERNINVHGKNSLQHHAVAPLAISVGDVIRSRQRIVLDVAPGQYTFGIGLATIDPLSYAEAGSMSYSAIAEVLQATLIINNAGAFSVVARRVGQALPHHGLCNLGGDVRIAVSSDRSHATVDIAPVAETIPEGTTGT
jgi:lipopolysaccharide transport system ATP-binding protein